VNCNTTHYRATSATEHAMHGQNSIVSHQQCAMPKQHKVSKVEGAQMHMCTGTIQSKLEANQDTGQYQQHAVPNNTQTTFNAQCQKQSRHRPMNAQDAQDQTRPIHLSPPWREAAAVAPPYASLPYFGQVHLPCFIQVHSRKTNTHPCLRTVRAHSSCRFSFDSSWIPDPLWDLRALALAALALFGTTAVCLCH